MVLLQSSFNVESSNGVKKYVMSIFLLELKLNLNMTPVLVGFLPVKFDKF